MKSKLFLFISILFALGSYAQVNPAKLSNAKPVGGTILRSITSGDTSILINQGAPGIVEIPMLDGSSKLKKAYLPQLFKSDVGLNNVPNIDATVASNINQSASYRFTNDTEKGNWNKKSNSVNSITDLRSISTIYLVDGMIYNTLGYKSATSGGGASFKWNSTSIAVDDTAFTIKPTSVPVGTPGRFEYIYNGVLNIRQAGAFGDNSTDDTWAIQKAQNYVYSRSEAQRYGDIYFPAGYYIVNGMTINRPRINWYCSSQGSAIIKLANNSNKDVVTIRKEAFLTSIRNFIIFGNKSNQTASSRGIYVESTANNTGYNDNIFINKALEGSSNYSFLSLRDIVISKCKGSGLEISKSNYLIDIYNLYVSACDGIGFRNLSTDNKGFTNITVERSGLSGIQEEGSNNRWSTIKTIFNGLLAQDTSAGFKLLNSRRSLIQNIESQDNFSDGFLFKNSHSITIVGCLADGNGYISDAIRLSSRKYVGYRFINSYSISTSGCQTSNYLGLRSDGFYIQESDFSIDSNCIDINVDGITSRTFKNSPNFGLFSGVTTANSSTLSCIRSSVYPSVDSVYSIDQPIITKDGLFITSNDNVQYSANISPKKSFSFIIDFKPSSLLSSAAPVILVSDNGNFKIQYSNIGSKFVQFTLSVDGTKYTLSNLLDSAVYSLPLDSNIRIGFKAKIVGSKLILFSSLSWNNSGKPFNKIQSRIVNIGLKNIDSIDNITLLTGGSGFSMPGLVKRIMFTTKEIDRFDMQIYSDLDRYIQTAQYYAYFPSFMPQKSLTYYFSKLPQPSLFYRGMTFIIDGSDDIRYTCLKNGHGYIWISNPISFTYSVSSPGTTTVIIPHSLGSIPSSYYINPENQNASGINWSEATTTAIILHYQSAPVGTLNYRVSVTK